MQTKYGKEVLQGLDILRTAIANDLLPHEFVAYLYPLMVKLVGEAGLASLSLLPPDDQDDLRDAAERVRTILRETGLSD